MGKNRRKLSVGLLLICLYLSGCAAKPAETATGGSSEPAAPPQEISTEAMTGSEQGSQSVDAPEESESVPAKAVFADRYDVDAVNDELAEHGLREYESSFLKVGAVDGLIYLDQGDGAAIYSSGIYCGWVAAWDVSDMDRLVGEKTLDNYVENCFGGTSSLGSERTETVNLPGEITRYTYANRVLYSKVLQDRLAREGLCADYDEALERCAFEITVTVYQKEESLYGYILYLENGQIEEESIRSLVEGIGFTEESFQEERSIQAYEGGIAGRYCGEVRYIGDGPSVALGFGEGELSVQLPAGMIAVQVSETEWQLYRFSRAATLPSGWVTVSKVSGSPKDAEAALEPFVRGEYDSKGLKAVEGGWIYSGSFTENLFSEEQAARINQRADAGELADTVRGWEQTLIWSESDGVMIDITIIQP